MSLFESDALVAAILKFSGLNDGEEGVISTPQAIPELVLNRWLWRAASPRAQARICSQFSSALTSSSRGNFNSKRLHLVGGLHAMLRALSDQSLPEESVGSLLAVIQDHLVDEKNPADLNDVVMCILSCFPSCFPASSVGGGGADSLGNGTDNSSRVRSDGEHGGGAAGRVRRVEVANALLGVVVELQFTAQETGDSWDEWREALHKSFGSRTLVKLLRVPLLHPSTAIVLLQILLLHINSRPKHMARFKGMGGFEALKQCMMPLCDCPYIMIICLHLLFGIPLKDLSGALDQEVSNSFPTDTRRRRRLVALGGSFSPESKSSLAIENIGALSCPQVLIVLVSEMAKSVTAIAYPEAMSLYCLMVKELCTRDGHASTFPPPWEDICRLPTHTDPIEAPVRVPENTVPHRVLADQQRSLAATAMQLLSLLFETCSVFQAKLLTGDFNESLLALLLSPALCAPPLTPSHLRFSRGDQGSSDVNDISQGAFEGAEDNSDGMMSPIEEGAEQDELSHASHATNAEEGAELSHAANAVQSVMPAMDDGESAAVAGGRWHQAAFNVERKENNEQAELLKSDTARVIMIHEFVDDSLIDRLRARMEVGRKF